MRGVMIRGLTFFIAVCFIVVSVMPLAAADADRPAGEVLFAERYSDYTSLNETGLNFGTASWTGAVMGLDDGQLAVRASSDERTYVLFPESVFTDSYTIRLTFRFMGLYEANGCIGIILTSSGEAPVNRTEVLIHANGSCGEFGQLSTAFAAAMTAGSTVSVSIPVEHGMLHEMTLASDGMTETLRLTNVRAIASGGRGLTFRYASVAISSFEVINGTSFTSLSGVYATSSYKAPADFTPRGVAAPYTPDLAVSIALSASVSAFGCVRLIRRKTR